MSTTLCILEGVEVIQDNDKHVSFTADADIDADGANGQNGGKPAYKSDNSGSEALANGGMKIEGGQVVFAASWGKDIVLVKNGRPLVLPDGVIPSRTSYKFKGREESDPAAYVDAETVPYIVVSPTIRNKARGVVLGSQARVTNTANGKSVDAVVADIGPRNKIGELSIAAARAIGVPSSPRTGGEERKIIKYEFWPDKAASVNGVAYDLMPA